MLETSIGRFELSPAEIPDPIKQITNRPTSGVESPVRAITVFEDSAGERDNIAKK
jgi:hypothetical protein